MSIQKNIDYHAQSLADKALSAKDPSVVQSILSNLTSSIQNGAVKPYVGIPLVQSLNQHLQGLTQQANMVAALRNPPPVAPDQSIGAQTLNQANTETNPGIDAMPSNLPEQMAGGGIVAFADGGDVEHYANKGYVAPTEEDWMDEYRRTRQLGEANLVTKRYGMPTKSVTEAGIKTPYDAAIDYYKQEANKNALAFDQGPALGESVGNLMKRRAAWLEGSRDPFTDLPPTGSKYNPSGIADITPKATEEKPPIVIHDDKPSTRDTTPQVDVKATKTDFLDELFSKRDKDREDLKAMILGDEAGRAKDKKTDMWLEALKGAFKLMGGTSPYAAVNLGAAGESLATGISGVITRDREEKNKRVGQLVALGLKGQELDAELAKLGMTRDYYDAHKKLYEAQAGYYSRRSGSSGSGTAGMGSVPGNVVQAELDRIEGYKTNPKSAPFFMNLPLDVQTALAKTDPKSGSYQKAMVEFNKEANNYAQTRLGIMRAYGAKQYPTTVSNELP